ncbi:MAG: metallophosphoesterase [Acidobacteriota bacterium]
MTSTLAVDNSPATEDQLATPEPPRRWLTRRRFLGLTAASAVALPLYAGEISRHELSVEEHTLHLARLPEAFRGMRIVQASDFHFAEYTEAWFLREMVHRINRLRPDMVLLTGDFVSFLPLQLSFARRMAPECAAILNAIECPLRYAILGNHDYVVGADFVAQPLREHGIPVLMNSALPLERNGQRVWLAGTGSACTGDADLGQAIPRQAAGEPILLMAHEPDILPEVAKRNVDLMLSGHTHGGQVRFPFLPPLVLPDYGKIYVEGLFRMGSTQLYVNRGIGAVGLPFRFRCPPEITVFTLA